jgi:hypothetical protein
MALFSLPAGSVYAQQPTGSIPTVTGTPAGPFVTVYSDQKLIGVFAGPSSYSYGQIGLLLAGEKAPALGYSFDGEWIKIIYLGVPGNRGWVYAALVSISQFGSLPYVDSPPTALPRTTPTIDPTLAAAFQVPLNPTRLPTYTPPPPLQVPTYTPEAGGRSGLPIGFVILGLAFIGIFGAVISFLRGR